MNAALTSTANPFHGTRRQQSCLSAPESETPRVYHSTPPRLTLPKPKKPASPEAIGRLLGIATASGLGRPAGYSSENDPLYWIGFMSEADVVNLIHATGGGLWQIDISKIDIDDDRTRACVTEAVACLCDDEFRRLNPEFDDCSGDHIFPSINKSIDVAWMSGMTLPSLIAVAREEYPEIISEIKRDRACARAHSDMMEADGID